MVNDIQEKKRYNMYPVIDSVSGNYRNTIQIRQTEHQEALYDLHTIRIRARYIKTKFNAVQKSLDVLVSEIGELKAYQITVLTRREYQSMERKIEKIRKKTKLLSRLNEMLIHLNSQCQYISGESLGCLKEHRLCG